MFEVNETISDLVEKVYKLTLELDRGDCLEHEAIEAILKCERHTGHWPAVMNKVRRRLEEQRGIATWPEPTVGYRLLSKPEQLLMLPRARLRRSSRQVRRAIRSVSALSSGGLSIHEKRIRAAQLESLKSARSELQSQLCRQGQLARKTEALPRPKAAVQPEAFLQPVA